MDIHVGTIFAPKIYLYKKPSSAPAECESFAFALRPAYANHSRLQAPIIPHLRVEVNTHIGILTRIIVDMSGACQYPIVDMKIRLSIPTMGYGI